MTTAKIGHEGEPPPEGKETLERRTPVIVAGLPGKMATLVAEAITGSKDYFLQSVGLSSVARRGSRMSVLGEDLLLARNGSLEWLKHIDASSKENTIVVDYTIPGAVNDNAKFYVQMGLPFVMGTTGGDREKLFETVRNSRICAVIAPNMAAEVVRVQQMIETLAQNTPGLLNGWRARISESHQESKRDVSGTAKALQAQFERLGAVLIDEIESFRDPRVQERVLRVPAEYLGGHAYHWITLESPDGVSKIEFKTKINGRQPYVEGTLMALKFLQKQMAAGEKGQVFTMIDVLKGQN